MKLPQTLFAAVLLLSACAAPAAQRTFDLRAPAVAPTAREDGAAGDGLLRAAEAPAADAGELAPGDSVTLLLFDGERIDLEIEEASATTFSGSRAFLGRTAGSPLRNAVLLADAEGGLHARIQGLDEGRVLRVFPRGEATAVEESEPAPVVEEEVPAAPAAAPASADAEPPVPTADRQSDHIVDVLVGFDRGAAAWAKNNGGATNFAETAVQNMNLALANSNLDGYFRFRLVGVAFIDERDTAVRSALHHATNGADGWAVVGPAASACGADVVTVLIDTGLDTGTTGIGWALGATTAQEAANFDGMAINACAIRAVAKGPTMTHEVGHNLGCGHSNAEGASDPGPQSFPYSSGYHFVGSDGKRYHTIMAYNSLNGESYALANVFSSPELTHAGVPAGTAEANDNRRVLTQSWKWAQDWRDTVVPLSYDVFFTPESGTFIEGSLSVALEPGREGLPVRYTLDGSAPTLSSPLYSGPIALTRTTTIRAAAVCNGVLGPVCTARYFVADLAAALDTPDLVWSTSTSRPWTFQADTTWDGVDAVRSGACTSRSDPGLYATVPGPTVMSFRWCAAMHNSSPYMGDGTPQDALEVYVDGTRVWSESATGVKSDWKQSQAEIPEGEHVVSFKYVHVSSSTSYVSGREYAAWIDDVRFGAVSKPPVLSPATTDAEATATPFAVTQTVSISAPGGAESMVFYTTDGSDPIENGALYGGPFEISASTRVRAVAVDPGSDTSVETAGLYLERHRPVRPGEWTADADGLLADAAADSSARLILGLWSNAGEQVPCETFRTVAEDPAFTSWCAANGVYLLLSDTTVHPDGVAAKDLLFGWMKQLHPSSSPVYGPMLVAARPDGTLYDAGAADTFAIYSGATFGSETYEDTVDSLVACIASIIGGTPLSPPSATPDGELVAGFPVSVTLANPNGSGTLRYTLDGSAPTAASPAYAGSAIQIRNGQILSAAVFPAASVALTSPVLVRNYRTVAGFFGIPEDAFDWEPAAGDYPWRVHDVASEPTLRSGNNGSLTYGPTYQSVLRATARTAGTLSFRIGDLTYSDNKTFFTAPDGSTTLVKSSTVISTDWKSLSVPVEAGDVLLWTRDVQNAFREFEAYDAGGSLGIIRCGAYLSKVSWTPSRDATDTPVPVPFSWLEDLFPGQASSPEAYDALAETDSDGDGFATWKEYLCGTSPADGTDFLRATIRMEGDTPVVGWNLTAPLSGARCVVEGVTAIPAKESDWTSPAPANATFFRVRVLAPGE